MAKRRRKKTAAMAPRQAKRTKSAMMLSVFPLSDDLINAVFLRLPARTVAVCRCVSPAWNHRLSSPAFTEVFHALSAAARGAPRFVSVPVLPSQHDDDRRRHGNGKTCQGLFLLWRRCEGAFAACNPSTGGVLRLPPRRPERRLLHSAGLGYDAAAGAHKAVVLERVEDLPRPRIRRLRCVVVTLGCRQRRWRAPRGPRAAYVALADAIVSADLDPVFADGRLHWKLHAPRPPTAWRAADPPGEPNGILSFSLGTESFSRIPLPPFAATQRTTMGELDGRLCMVRDLRGYCKAGTSVLEVWKLHGHDESGSWSLDYRIDLARGGNRSLPWILTAVSPLRYMGGGGDERRRILLSAMEEHQTAAAYIYGLDSGGLQNVARSSYTGRERRRFLLYQESPLHIAGMEYGTEVVKKDHIYI